MSRRKRTKGYDAAVLAAAKRAQASGALRAGQVYAVTVRHDPGCSFLAGKGSCDCTPEVRAPKRIARLEEN